MYMYTFSFYTDIHSDSPLLLLITINRCTIALGKLCQHLWSTRSCEIDDNVSIPPNSLPITLIDFPFLFVEHIVSFYHTSLEGV